MTATPPQDDLKPCPLCGRLHVTATGTQPLTTKDFVRAMEAQGMKFVAGLADETIIDATGLTGNVSW